MLLLLIIAIWSVLLLLVVGLCAGARLGDAAQCPPEPLARPARMQPPVEQPARAAARAQVAA
jgi:hypothetical protein